jgi:hypothetical protein
MILLIDKEEKRRNFRREELIGTRERAKIIQREEGAM